MKFDLQKKVFLDFFITAGTNLFDMSVSPVSPSSERKMIPFYAKTYQEVEQLLRWAGWKNRENNADVYFRPARTDLNREALPHAVVFLDDLLPLNVLKIAQRYKCALVRTSHGRYHAWIMTSRPLAEAERHAVQKRLAAEYGADKGSTSGEHWGRMPGFRNRKPDRDGCWVTLEKVAMTGSVLAVDIVEAGYEKHRVCTKSQLSRQESISNRDESAAEFGYAINAIRNGVPIDQVSTNLYQHCYLRRGTDSERYVNRTIKACLERLGMQVEALPEPK